MSRVRLSELLGESLRAARGRPWRFTLIVLVAAITIGGAMLLEGSEGQSLNLARAEATAEGAYVLIVGNDGGDFDGTQCSVFSQVPEIVAAGAIYNVRAVRSTDVPSTSFQLATVTPGFLRLVDPGIQTFGNGIYALGDAVQEDIGLGRGSVVRLQGEPPGSVGAIETSQQRAENQSRWIYRTSVLPLNARIVQCWIETTPDAHEAVKDVLPAVFSDLSKLSVRTLEATDALEFAEARYTDRLSQYAWVLAGVFLGTLAGATALGRRAEFALYVVCGFDARDVTLMQLVDYWVLAGSAACLAAPTAVVVLLVTGGYASSSFELAGMTLVLSLLLGSLTSTLISLPAGMGNISRSLKNRD